MKKKCYNAGKIGGLHYTEYLNNFDTADREIEMMNYIPINPIFNGLKENAPYYLHMVVDLWMLVRCSAVYFQRNWQDSRGARIEHRAASLLFKKKLYQDE